MAGGKTKAQVKKVLRTMGFELQRFDPEGSFAKRRQRLLESKAVNLVIDVGAHAGEFGQALRHNGYQGRILSFEPISEYFDQLQRQAEADGNWSCKQAAIGERAGEIEINISGNDGFSSSVREMTGRHEAAAPDSAYVSSERVSMRTLDEAVGGDAAQGPFLKVDTQGYEEQVLAGGRETLEQCQAVELEVAFVELYANQSLFADIIEQMRERRMVLADLEPGFRDSASGELLQADAIFIRADGAADVPKDTLGTMTTGFAIQSRYLQGFPPRGHRHP